MKTTRKNILFLALMFSVLMANAADNATKILDMTSDTYKKSGDVKVGFSIEIGGQSSTGVIKLSGQKFCVSTGGSVAWFDGKTMWHYVKDNDEVNVTNPSEKELTKMNPYAFLNIYKKGYKCKVIKTTDKEYYVTLSGKKGSAYKNIEVHINKTSYQPTYVKMETAKRTTVVKVNSYVKNQKFPATDFTFSKKGEYKTVEIVDLR